MQIMPLTLMPVQGRGTPTHYDRVNNESGCEHGATAHMYATRGVRTFKQDEHKRATIFVC